MKFIYLIASLFITCSIFSQVNAVSAGIQNTGMPILYAGIPIKMEPFGGKNCENIRLVGCEKAEDGSYYYTATQSQIGQTVSISIEEKDKKGNYKVVHTTIYLVRPSPKPELMWGELTDGGKVSSLVSNLTVAYGNNVLLSGRNFTVEGYSIFASGVKGTLEGTGSEISEIHLLALKSLPAGTKVSISVKYSYSGTGAGRVSAMYEL